jgi:hypothetical protein
VLGGVVSVQVAVSDLSGGAAASVRGVRVGLYISGLWGFKNEEWF